MTTQLRVVSWNVLADAYAKPERYPFTAAEWLEPNRRRQTVAELALSFDADIIALQEADLSLVNLFAEQLSGDWFVGWCPKGKNRPDGCLMLVRRPWHVLGEQRLAYNDGLPASGHVAQVVWVSNATNQRLTVANTHLRWAAPGTLPAAHLGLVQAQELTDALGFSGRTVIAADSNDPPGGPVRQHIAEQTYTIFEPPSNTAVIGGTEGRQLDFVAGSGVKATYVGVGANATVPLPGPSCPSDHVPVLVDLSWD